ncbi:MAG: hypothetical protein M1820_003832 [Bogoriella megaspora]|nr:MAG: hypothetical protein M1820_003832 [Bogoriella megaspora]
MEQGIEDALAFLGNDLETSFGRSRQATPPSSQNGHATGSGSIGINAGSGIRISKKRVIFSPWAKNHEADYGSERPTLAPSRESKQARSILKHVPSPPTSSPPDKNKQHSVADDPVADEPMASFETMLDRSLEQLSHHDDKSKRDAYVDLYSILGACEVPSDEAGGTYLQQRAGRLVCFIKRDCGVPLEADSEFRMGVAIQGLKLLGAILISSIWPKDVKDELCVFLFEASAAALRNAQTPKMLVRQYMSLLVQHGFDSASSSLIRTEKIMEALDDLETRFGGNSIIAGRLALYQKVLNHSRSLVLSRINVVVEHMFHAMLSNIEDIRIRAINLGMHVAFSLGCHSRSNRAVSKLFDATSDSEEPIQYASFYVSKLERMYHTKSGRPHVPEIWAVVILFFQNQSSRLRQWRHFPMWMQLIQRCLNSKDAKTKRNAYIAWNRFVFAIRPDRTTSAELVNLLLRPIKTQLETNPPNEENARLQRAAWSSYCNLLYYSLRPSATAQELDTFWDAYISNGLSGLASKGNDQNMWASAILRALFDNSSDTAWDENRISMSKPVMHSDLAGINAKWLRQRIAKVLPPVERCLETDICCADPAQPHYGLRTWRVLMTALAAAGSQEVKASSELREAIAQVVSCLHRLETFATTLRRQSRPTAPDAKKMLSEAAIFSMEALGPFNFTEKLLVQKRPSEFKVAPSPSHRSASTTKQMLSPLACLLRLRATHSSHSIRESSPAGLAELLKLACDSQNSQLARLQVLGECVKIFLDESLMEQTSTIVAAQVQDTLLRFSTTGSAPSQPNLNEYRTVISIICPLIRTDSVSPTTVGNLLDSLAKIVPQGSNSNDLDFHCLWSETFGRSNLVQFPEKTRAAINAAAEQTHVGQPNTNVHAQSESPPFLEREEVDASSESACIGAVPKIKDDQYTAGRENPPVLSSVTTQQGRQEVTPTPESRPISSPIRRTPLARLRHNDSQIEFTAIESSPTNFEAMESQLLTDHQKEIRAQQQAGAAAMFPDIRSSAKSASKLATSGRDVAAEVTRNYMAANLERPTTPPILAHDQTDDYLSSSPTPGSAARRDMFEIEEPEIAQIAVEGQSADEKMEDLPSSPPEICLGGDENNDISESITSLDGIQDVTPSKGVQTRHRQSDAGQDIVSTSIYTTEVPSSIRDPRRLGAQDTTETQMIALPDRHEAFADALKRLDEGFALTSEVDRPTRRDDGESSQNSANTDTSFVAESFDVELDGCQQSLDGVQETSSQADPQLQVLANNDGTSKTQKRKRRASTKLNMKYKKRATLPIQASVESTRDTESDEDSDACIVVQSHPQILIPQNPIAAMSSQVEDSSTALGRQGSDDPSKSASAAMVTTMPSSSDTKRKRSPQSDDYDETTSKEDLISEGAVSYSSPPHAPDAAKFSHIEIRATSSQEQRSRDIGVLNDYVTNTESVGSPKSNVQQHDDMTGGCATVDVELMGYTADSMTADDAASQQLIAEQEAANAAATRPIAKPKSILERLKRILADCKGAMFESEERLEAYDTLMDIQAEIRKNKGGE